MVISQQAPLDLLWVEMPGRRQAAIPFAGSQRSSSLKRALWVTCPNITPAAASVG